ncbi:MAG: hypothetical protein LBF65_02265 [Holosporales bacterium]|nr:hypothetical protein [Holosporales bacterium]
MSPMGSNGVHKNSVLKNMLVCFPLIGPTRLFRMSRVAIVDKDEVG